MRCVLEEMEENKAISKRRKNDSSSETEGSERIEENADHILR